MKFSLNGTSLLISDIWFINNRLWNEILNGNFMNEE